MKTESSVDETMKGERRKVFWRLYSLPWIIAVILLAMISVGFMFYIRDMHKQAFEQEQTIRAIGVLEGRKQLQMDAVDFKHALWAVNRFGEVSFHWKKHTIETPVTNPLPRARSFQYEEEAPKELEERDYSYTWDNHLMGLKLGMNFEEMVIGSARIAIQKQFKKNDLSEEGFKVGVETSIKKEFDGFETYNKN